MRSHNLAINQQDPQWEPDPSGASVADRPITHFTWGAMGAGLALVWSPVLLAVLLSAFDEGTRVMMGIKPMAWVIDPLIYLAFYGVAIHLLLSFPLIQIGYAQTKSFKFPVLRLLTLFALVTAPLCSYAYYRAGNLSSGQWVEILLAVVPVTLVASLCYYRLERRWLFSAWIAVGTYVPVFLINDLMGPYSTYFAYASPYDWFYYFRYIGPMTGIVYFLWLFLSKRELLAPPLLTADSAE